MNIQDIPRWSKRLQEAYDKGYADAKKEVIDEIKGWAMKSLFHGNVEELDCLNELLDVLATLREEEST